MYYLTPQQLKKQVETLSSAFLFLNNEDETFDFLRTLLTQEEYVELHQRLQIAIKLYFRTPYAQIEKELGVSSTTIARVSKIMKEPNNGYTTLIQRMYDQESTS